MLRQLHDQRGTGMVTSYFLSVTLSIAGFLPRPAWCEEHDGPLESRLLPVVPPHMGVK